jgi:hypothetical protein
VWRWGHNYRIYAIAEEELVVFSRCGLTAYVEIEESAEVGAFQ